MLLVERPERSDPAWHFHDPPLRRKMLRLSSIGAILRRRNDRSPVTVMTCSSARQSPFIEPKRFFGRAKAAAIWAFLVAASLWPDDCSAGSMVLMESYPAVNEIMDGSATSFTLRFDGPVDHAGAQLTLVTPAGTRVLHARLSSQPNTLFVAVGMLASGAYRLTWMVRAPDGHLSRGDIPFQVTRR